MCECRALCAQPDILSAASRTESAAKGEPPSLFATRDGGRLARQAGPSSPVCAPLSSFVLRGERTVEAVVSRRTRESVRQYAPRSVKAVSAYCRRLLATASMRFPTRLPCARKTGKRLLVRRPSDRRGSGSDPEPQYAFKMSMFNVSCNSH